MKCRECANGRRFAENGIWCVMYGMILSEKHECTLEGGRPREDRGDGSQGEAELHEDGGGAS